MDHQTIHCDPHAYSAHPHLAVVANDNWLLAFTQSRRRAGVLHPPQDPLYCNMLMRSADEGRSWSAPSIIPGFGWQGVECAGLTPLRSGVVLLNQWRFDWHTLAYAQAHLAPDAYRRPEELVGAEAMAAELRDWTPQKSMLAERYPWARGGGQTWVHRSVDGGNTFTTSTRIETAPFSGGYGMRGGIEVDGEIVLPLCDVPNYAAVFTVRSGDSGRSWSEPRLVAAGVGHAFEEPAPILLRDGRIVMLLRDNVSRILHVVSSEDGGVSWSAPSPTGIEDYPADMVELDDGRIACVAGRRRAPFGIALYISQDKGSSWNSASPYMVRSGLPNRDLGYPSLALRADGSLYVVYYAQDPQGITGIHASVLAPGADGWHQEGLAYGQG
jgi:hypothetical protein